MKRTLLIAVILGLAVIGFFATDASAYYDPGTGRFLSRDPGLEGTMGNPQVASGGSVASGGFLPRDPINTVNQPNMAVGVLQHNSTEDTQYADGPNLYQYVRSNPCLYTDPDGMKARLPGWKSRCCKKAEEMGLDNGHGGGVICCDGKKVSCAWDIPDMPGDGVLKKCILEHEDDHHDDIDCPKCGISRSPFKPGSNPNLEECKAYRIEIECLRKNRGHCNWSITGRKECKQNVDNRISQLNSYGTSTYHCNPPLK